MGEDLLPVPQDDGLPVRDAGAWVRDKLRILAAYVPAFGHACKRARRWYYVDGFAGPGVNRIRGTQELVFGSPMIALRAVPAFARCLLLEGDITAARALAVRTHSFGDRAVVHPADCNAALVPLMDRYVERSQPCLCVLDPEGTELEWQTVDAVARFRKGDRKVEQLILFPTDTGFVRMLPLWAEIEPWNEQRLDAMFPDGTWRDVWAQRRAHKLTADEARTRYVELYADGLRQLGYRHVLDRPIHRRARTGPILYFLIFATDHDVGRDIMDRCFEMPPPEPHAEQLAFPGMPRPDDRRLPH